MGAIIYVCQELEVQFELLTPTQARKILTGDGKLKKDGVAKYIEEKPQGRENRRAEEGKGREYGKLYFMSEM